MKMSGVSGEPRGRCYSYKHVLRVHRRPYEDVHDRVVGGSGKEYRQAEEEQRRRDERVTHLFICHGYRDEPHGPDVFRQVGQGNVNTREGCARLTTSWTDKS